MKKSQLRKLIRESIRGLMNEQNSNYTPGIYVKARTCDDSSNSHGNSGSTVCMAITSNPQVGDVFVLNGLATWQNHPLDGMDLFITGLCDDNVCPQSCWASVAYPHAPSSATCNSCCGFNPASNQPGGWSSLFTSTWASGACWDNCCSQGLVPQSGATAGNWPVGGMAGTPYPGCPGTSSPCDQTPASSCATQWFGPIANSPGIVTWMASKDCSNYQSIVNQLEPQAIAIMNDPNNTSNPQLGPYNNWNDIKNAANTAGLSNTPPPPVKSQFKRKMAKAMYAQCQITDCNC